TSGNILASTSNITDMDVSSDGAIWVAANITDKLYKSTDGGATFSGKGIDGTDNATFVAVAPDDSDVVVYADADSLKVVMTLDGGTNWNSLGVPREAALGTATSITDIDVSPESGGAHYIAVAGGDSDGDGNIWYYKLAAGQAWTETNTLGGFGMDVANSTAGAVEFSPGFASDKLIVSVIGDTTTDNVSLALFSTTKKLWNTSAGFTSYPAEIVDAAGMTALTRASLALSPDYLGSDDSLMISFVGLDLTGAAAADDGIWRMKQNTPKQLKATMPIYSVAYDGTNLVAGAAATTAVYRCADSLASSPTVSGSTSSKQVGGDDKVVVAWNGADVVAGAQGNESAFASSADNGKMFTDLSLIDTAVTSIEQVAVSSDGEVIYLGSTDLADYSLFRKKDGAWNRVFKQDAKSLFLIRLAPEDPDVIYVVDKGTTDLWVNTEGGDAKWFARAFRYSGGIQDLAIESADVAYAAVSGANTISKTTNSGFTWGGAKSTSLTSGNIHMVTSVGEDNVIVGGAGGYISYSTDGNSSWTNIKKVIDGAVDIQVTASGLSDGDFIYVAGTTAAKKIQRWEVGSSTSWKDLSATTTGLGAYGIALVEDVLYVSMATGIAGTDNSTTLRTLSPTSSEPSSGMWSTDTETGAQFTAVPRSLVVSSGSTKLWSANSTGAQLYSYTDTLATDGITLSAPGDGAEVQMNPVSGGSYALTLSWERLSKSLIYDYQVATDSGFVEKVLTGTTASSTSSTPSFNIDAGSLNPGTTYYWRIRTNIAGPARSQWSATRSFTVGELPEAQAPVVIQAPPPAPVIQIPPAPAITLEPPEIVLPAPPPAPPEIVIPAAPPPAAPAIPSWAIYAIIIIGAVLVIALIVLIMRTRRPV
ncbi:MAG: hypothetical protein V3W44_06690, partial [Dehalococcoidales bacterium]